MNVLFLSLGEFNDFSAGSVHIDLMKEFSKHNNVYLLCKTEKRSGQETHLTKELEINVLRVKTGNIKNTNLIEKGISTILVEPQFKAACKKYFSDIKFDLIIYTTPPITFAKVVKYIKKRDHAKTYLLLKDIFPQNAVDLGMMTTTGLKGIVYKYFRRKEKLLYSISDKIGCMSPANVKYILDHNPEINPEKIEICPNAIEIIDKSVDDNTCTAIRDKYGIPLDKYVFIYGGNLGKPQGIPYLIECLKTQHIEQAYFLIVGDGTEYYKLEAFINESKPANVKLMKKLPKEDYDTVVAACDVGMIFLDHRFTIPNFPSRLLSYMQAHLPVLACTDPNTDLGQVIQKGEFGWWCESNDVNTFLSIVREIIKDKNSLKEFKCNSFDMLKHNYSVDQAYKTIIDFWGN